MNKPKRVALRKRTRDKIKWYNRRKTEREAARAAAAPARRRVPSRRTQSE
jgi:hypothetical protein